MSFASNSGERSTRLRDLLNNTLNSIHEFCASVLSAQRTKVGLAKLIMDDFQRQTNELVRLSIEDRYELVSPPARCPRLQLLLPCQFVHDRCDVTIAFHLLGGVPRKQR